MWSEGERLNTPLVIRRASSWRELGANTSSFGVPVDPNWTTNSYGTEYGNTTASGQFRQIGQQPIFSTKAHVFQIDPETKKNWIPASKVAVSVSYYYDSTRNTYRIISVDGSKAIINSTITPNMTFTKTSQKFGQWSDARANTVYGLGFNTEAELAKFIEKFKEVKELTRRAVATEKPSSEVNGGIDGSPQPTPTRTSLHQRTNSLSSIQTDSTNLQQRRNSFTQGSNGLPSNHSEAQLKYENDRLKLALAQSSANAKKWEVELTTLKNNNARLTAALQESTANVEEWKKQLATYKEENARLRKKVLEKEHEGNVQDSDSQALQQEMQALGEEATRLKGDNKLHQQEIVRLTKQLEEMTSREALTSSFQARIQNLEEENHNLILKLQDVQRQLQESRSSRDTDSQELLQLQEALGSKITDLYELHEQIIASIRKESNS
ncbi:hypothetical protein C0Q70_20659 [Pomacea canaliculata]|uniref:WH1 domain-containing protein n=1 Tax=Pomacea canaliculata TaxID=400727 RepID=A0A2T7NG85_POMCA|nr:hypothetical protein C0Q70_20659 [Pomacea canaliculata]